MLYNKLNVIGTVILLTSCSDCVYGGDSCYTSYLKTSYCTYGCCYSSYSTYASCCTHTLSVGSWVGIGVGTAVVIGVCVLVYYLWKRRVAARRAATVAILAQGAQAPYPQWQLTTVPSPVGNLPPQYNLYPNVPTVSPNLYPNVPTVSPNIYPNVPTVSPGYLPFEPPMPQSPAQNDPKASRKRRRILKGIVTALTWI
ncbi:uncharacterized protein LOC127872617 [Dreissena polymorpha]|uniref:Uncharacterized protein n=1 Tax=Dreissena polymorpha TaxID=45954 RepID=A0A9D4LI53_DREPO|nr:uncharacterized protein LOC127872617 [Dreissena polymorpha]KAH3858204.1 hypothetical protein DPMN_100823 [Dreissena polymorpha]